MCESTRLTAIGLVLYVTTYLSNAGYKLEGAPCNFEADTQRFAQKFANAVLALGLRVSVGLR